MQYWSAIAVIKQVCGELGLTTSNTVVGQTAQDVQMLAALNSAGNEMLTLYPWAWLSKEWTFDTVEGQGDYDLPADWSYFTDQTQWDRTNHWPLLGPKTPQEWAWLKGGIVAAAPRMRYRVQDGKFKLWPVPAAAPGGVFVPQTMSMEYVSDGWVIDVDGVTPKSMVTLDAQTILYNPWLAIKFTKVKFLQLKGFDSKAAETDFTRLFNSLTGKDTGAGVLSLSPSLPPQFIGPWSVPDGSWNTGGA